MELIQNNMAQIIALCEKHDVSELCVFGSILTERFRSDSDVDFLVIFKRDGLSPFDYADNYFSLKFGLEDLLHREIDLIEYEAVKNPYFKEELDETKVIIYSI